MLFRMAKHLVYQGTLWHHPQLVMRKYLAYTPLSLHNLHTQRRTSIGSFTAYDKLKSTNWEFGTNKAGIMQGLLLKTVAQLTIKQYRWLKSLKPMATKGLERPYMVMVRAVPQAHLGLFSLPKERKVKPGRTQKYEINLSTCPWENKL